LFFNYSPADYYKLIKLAFLLDESFIDFIILRIGFEPYCLSTSIIPQYIIVGKNVHSKNVQISEITIYKNRNENEAKGF